MELPNIIERMNVLFLYMVPTGTYNQMFMRPLESRMSETSIQRFVNRAINDPSMRVSPSALSGVASEIICPQAAPHTAVNIVNGWTETRYRFVLAVECRFASGSTTVYYMQGYTSHDGVGTVSVSSAAIDPQMKFTVNSFSTVTRTPIPTPTGVVYRDTVSDTAQIFSGPDGNQFSTAGLLYGLRPFDVLASVQSNYYANGNSGEFMVADGRATMNNTTTRSHRRFAVPAEYIAGTVNAYLSGQDLSEFGQSNVDIMSSAMGRLAEPAVIDNYFFQVLANNRFTNKVNVFTWDQLLRVDPTTSDRTKIIKQGNMTAMPKAMAGTRVHQAGSTSYWTGSNRATQMAAMLSHALPSLMMGTMISRISFIVSNYDLATRDKLIIVPESLGTLANIDMRKHLVMFEEQVSSMILSELSMSGHESYYLDVVADIFGDTWIKIRLGADDVEEFVVPSFCDSLFSPMLTYEQQGATQVVDSINYLMSYVSEEMRGNSAATQLTAPIAMSSGV